jgi:hypothetical protein
MKVISGITDMAMLSIMDVVMLGHQIQLTHYRYGNAGPSKSTHISG